MSQIISNDISELQVNQATTAAKITQYKRKLMDLSHRVLQVYKLSLISLHVYRLNRAKQTQYLQCVCVC